MFIYLISLFIYSNLLRANGLAIGHSKELLLSTSHQKTSDIPISTEEVLISVEPVNLDDIMYTCNQSFRISMDYLEDLNNTGSFPDEADKTPMCYIRCYLERAGILNDGQIDKNKAVELLWPATGDSLNVCEAEGKNERNPCQKAYFITRCMMTRALVDGRNKNIM